MSRRAIRPVFGARFEAADQCWTGGGPAEAAVRHATTARPCQHPPAVTPLWQNTATRPAISYNPGWTALQQVLRQSHGTAAVTTLSGSSRQSPGHGGRMRENPRDMTAAYRTFGPANRGRRYRPPRNGYVSERGITGVWRNGKGEGKNGPIHTLRRPTQRVQSLFVWPPMQYAHQM